jgi:VWFA-related protein
MRLVLIGAMLLIVAVPQRFRSGADAVRVDVLVTDGSRPIRGLTAEDFELNDGGVSQRILSVTVDDVPMSILLALDASTSVEGPTLAGLKNGVRAAIATLGPKDRAALMTFGSAVDLRADWGADGGAIEAAMARVSAAGTTSLYDAAFSALTLKDTVTGNRSLVLLFSDGADTASWLSRRAVLEKANRTDVVVYAIVRRQPSGETLMQYRSGIEVWPRPARAPFRPDPFVEELADLTGGDTIVAASGDRLQDAFARIASESRSRYMITYIPEGVPPDGWHPIDVRLKRQRGAIRARRGYFRDLPGGR